MKKMFFIVIVAIITISWAGEVNAQQKESFVTNFGIEVNYDKRISVKPDENSHGYDYLLNGKLVHRFLIIRNENGHSREDIFFFEGLTTLRVVNNSNGQESLYYYNPGILPGQKQVIINNIVYNLQGNNNYVLLLPAED